MTDTILPPLSFSKLPREVRELIGTHIDKPTALSFALVESACSAAADIQIWREITLAPRVLKDGTMDLSAPYMQQGDVGQYRHWVIEAERALGVVKTHGELLRAPADEQDAKELELWAERAERAKRAKRAKWAMKAWATLRVVETILAALDPRRASMVEDLTMSPGQASFDKMITILTSVAPYIRTFTLNDTQPQVHSQKSFDDLFLSANLSFPSLTRIKFPYGRRQPVLIERSGKQRSIFLEFTRWD